MQNLRVFVETPADPVSAVLSDHRETFGFRIVLNNRPDISEMRPRLDHGDTQLKTFFGRFYESLRQYGRLADRIHSACVTMKSIFNDSDIDINDVTIFQALVSRDAVADDMINAGADRLWKAPIVKRGGNCLESIHDVVMADLVKLSGGYTRFNMRPDHVQD